MHGNDFGTGLMMSENSPQYSKDDGLALALGTGVLIACWDFFLMFRAWVVTTEAEIIGANIVFVLVGLLPWIGIVGSFRRKAWGPWMLIIGPIIAPTGFFFMVYASWQGMLAVVVLTFMPTIVIGTVLLKLIRRRAMRQPQHLG
jgi:hypothetical protein